MQQLNRWDCLPDSLLMHCVPCALLDHDTHDPLLGIMKQSLLWQSIPLGIGYNSLYRLGYSLMWFPIRYLHIVSGMSMPVGYPWCPRVIG